VSTSVKRGREYLRVSGDKSGRMESPAEQHDVNAEHAARSGWELGDPYAEPEAVSASRWSAKVRGAFAELLADLEAGRFGAEVLLMWESSRGSRRVGEWVRLIDACEGAGVTIYVTSHGRLYDPADDRDRRTLLEDAVDSEWESAKISKRVRRTTAARAARGEPHGRIPYGYRRVYDPLTRRLIAQEPHPEESAVIIELFERLLAGHAFKAIARDFRERGIMTRGTRKCPPHPFAPVALRAMALNPAYAGLRTWSPSGKRGVAEPRRPGSLRGAVEGTWPAIVDLAVFHAVWAQLTDPERSTWRPGGAKHLLTLIAACGACRGPLTVEYRHGLRSYVCRDGSHVKQLADEMDAAVADEIIEYLSRPDNAATQPSPHDAPELLRVRAELAAARSDLADWQRRAGRREVTPASFAAIEPVIIADVTRLEGRARELSAPPVLSAWLGSRAEVTARWEAAPAAARRRLARLLLSPAFLGSLRLERIGRGNSVPVRQRLTWDRDVPGAEVTPGHA
jgi:site-specific DNA recombinase